jgi:catechol 2,3-dioxygenase-like lactoylglutathione lyase family enzyme
MQFKVGEINVICSDIERSMHFYHEILGMDLVGREGRARRLRSHQMHILLLPTAIRPKAQEVYPEVPTISFDLMVDDLRSAHRHLYERGAELDFPLDPSARSFHVCDPDGLVLEIIAASKQSDQD